MTSVLNNKRSKTSVVHLKAGSHSAISFILFLGASLQEVQKTLRKCPHNVSKHFSSQYGSLNKNLSDAILALLRKFFQGEGDFTFYLNMIPYKKNCIKNFYHCLEN